MATSLLPPLMRPMQAWQHVHRHPHRHAYKAIILGKASHGEEAVRENGGRLKRPGRPDVGRDGGGSTTLPSMLYTPSLRVRPAPIDPCMLT